MSGGVRVALLTEIPAPYRLPLFRALAARDDVDPTVLFLGATDPRRSYPEVAGEQGFAHEVLPGSHLVRGGAWLALSRGVLRGLARLAPQVVVAGGWNQPAFWQALAYARVRRVPLVTWVESTARDARGSSPLAATVKRAFLRGSAAFLVPGEAAAAYLRSLGVEPARIHPAPNAVDAAAFAAGSRAGRTGPVRLLYAGRLAPEKGLDVLLEAVAGLPLELALAGGGPAGARLRAAAPGNVRFLGDLSQAGLAAAYAEADAFVLPSLSEPWGMVLNEAAAAGLPLVASDAVGAAPELVEDGRNGFLVPAGDADALRAALARLAADRELCLRLGAGSLERSARLTPAAWAASVAALARTLARG